MNVSAVSVNVGEPKGGALGKYFCSKRHPVFEDVWCRRQPDHEEECRAFTFRISEPEYWYPEEQL